MKHLILVKWKETVDDASQLKDEAEALFFPPRPVHLSVPLSL